MVTKDTDIMILASGGAGMFAALHAHKAAPELSISVAVKGLPGKCGCSRMVQGGYNVALAKEDSIERHFCCFTYAGTGSGNSFAFAPSTGEWAKQPTRSKRASLRKL